MTIKGVKNVIKSDLNKLDDYNADSLKADYYRRSLKNKSKLLLEKINKIKSYGKKTHLKVRMVPKTTQIVSLFITQKNLPKGKGQNKLKLKNIILILANTKFL